VVIARRARSIAVQSIGAGMGNRRGEPTRPTRTSREAFGHIVHLGICRELSVAVRVLC
jgi:hypothetical protein